MADVYLNFYQLKESVQGFFFGLVSCVHVCNWTPSFLPSPGRNRLLHQHKHKINSGEQRGFDVTNQNLNFFQESWLPPVPWVFFSAFLFLCSAKIPRGICKNAKFKPGMYDSPDTSDLPAREWYHNLHSKISRFPNFGYCILQIQSHHFSHPHPLPDHP